MLLPLLDMLGSRTSAQLEHTATGGRREYFERRSMIVLIRYVDTRAFRSSTLASSGLLDQRDPGKVMCVAEAQLTGHLGRYDRVEEGSADISTDW